MDRPNIIGTAVSAWRLALLCVCELPLLSLVTLPADMLIAWLQPDVAATTEAFLQGRPAEPATGLSICLLSYAYALANLPLELAAYRLILLEQPTLLVPQVAPALAGRFLMWQLAFATGGNLVLAGMMAESRPLTWAIMAIAALVWVVVGLRLTILLPAVAIAAGGDRLRQSWRGTRGHVWRMLSIIMVVALPMALVRMAVALATGADAASGPAPAPLSQFGRLGLSSAADAVELLLSVATSALLFRSYGWGAPRVAAPGQGQHPAGR